MTLTMFNFRLWSVLVLTVVLNASVINVFAATESKVEELVVKSGLQRQMSQIPEVVNASFEQRMSQDTAVKPEEVAKLRKAVAESITPSIILDTIKQLISTQFSDPDIDAILVWLNSTLGQKITQLEEAATSGQAYLELRAFAAELEKNPPDSARVDVLQQLDRAARMTEFSSGLKMDMTVNMTATMAAAAGRQDVKREDLMMAMEGNRRQIEEGTSQEVLMTGLYTYKSLSVEELQEYVKFYQSEAGQKYADVVTRGLSQALNNCFKEMGKRFGQVIKEVSSQEAEVKK